MMAAPPQMELVPPPPAPRLQARLNVAQDVIYGAGLVIGIVVGGLSLWALIGKYQAARAQRQPPPQ